MNVDKLEKYLDELSDGTDFVFTVSDVRNGEVELYMDGDNPCDEDWCKEIYENYPQYTRLKIKSEVKCYEDY